MSDGNFDQGRSEALQQANITRERFIVVNTSPTGDVTAGTGRPTASSSYASLDPGDTASGAAEGMGPHFVMSGRTSDGVHTLGFKVMFTTVGVTGQAAVANGAGFTITPWILVGSLQIPNLPSTFRQQWGSLAPATGVALRTWYHSFDVNACAIRFQISNVLVQGNIGIVFAEL